MFVDFVDPPHSRGAGGLGTHRKVPTTAAVKGPSWNMGSLSTHLHVPPFLSPAIQSCFFFFHHLFSGARPIPFPACPFHLFLWCAHFRLATAFRATQMSVDTHVLRQARIANATKALTVVLDNWEQTDEPRHQLTNCHLHVDFLLLIAVVRADFGRAGAGTCISPSTL